MKPIGIATSEIITVSVPLRANVRSPTVVFRGKSLVADSSIRRTVDDPNRNRINVPRVQMSKFLLFCAFPVSVDKLARDENLLVGRYLGKLGLAPRASR